MFEFTDEFDILENDELILKITQKYSGDNKMIPFYYYDILRKSDSATVGKISIRIGNNFHSLSLAAQNAKKGHAKHKNPLIFNKTKGFFTCNQGDKITLKLYNNNSY